MQQLKWIMQTVNSNQEVKPDSLLRALELLYILLDKSWGAQLPSWLKEKNRQVWWYKRWIASAMKVKKTSASNLSK